MYLIIEIHMLDSDNIGQHLVRYIRGQIFGNLSLNFFIFKNNLNTLPLLVPDIL